ncbi:hypothetical protein BCS93_11045 [Vibrio breoganii]|uniref:Uncharacterized protein n=1 Tax=Vibrio breoganii TaxID=553239 RepID=A0AAP8SWP3_9VIBR|nr:hypothetical protein BCS93_11045 [Vibrio breoganii]
MEHTEKRNDHEFAFQIDKALSDERAFLFVGEDGFFVLRPIVRKGITITEIMFAYAWSSNAIDTYQMLIEELALKAKASAIQLRTVVVGLIPSLVEQGFKKEAGNQRIMVWTKEIS